MKLQSETGPPEFLTGSRMESTVQTDGLKHDSESEKVCGVGALFLFSQRKQYEPQKEPTCDTNDRKQAYTLEALKTINTPVPCLRAVAAALKHKGCAVPVRKGETQLSKEVITPGKNINYILL